MTATTTTIPGTTASRGRPTTRRCWRAAPRDVRALLATLLASRGTPMLSMGDECGRTPGRQQQRLCAGQPGLLARLGGHGPGAAGLRRTAGAGAPGASGAACRGAADRRGAGCERPARRRLAAAGWRAFRRGDWGDAGGAQPGRGVLRAGAAAPRPPTACWSRCMARAEATRFAPPAPRPGFAWRVLADSADPAVAGAPPSALAPRSVLLLAEFAA